MNLVLTILLHLALTVFTLAVPVADGMLEDDKSKGKLRSWLIIAAVFLTIRAMLHPAYTLAFQ